MFQWIERMECSEGMGTGTPIAQGTKTDRGECSQERGESSHTQTDAAKSTSSNYLRGYLRGAIRAHGQSAKTFEDLLDAVEKLDLKNSDERVT